MAVHESDQIVDIIMVVPHCGKQPRYMMLPGIQRGKEEVGGYEYMRGEGRV
jgi:hypothetical protein